MPLAPNITDKKEIEDVSKFNLKKSFSSVDGLSVCFWIELSSPESKGEAISSIFKSKHLSLSITSQNLLIETPRNGIVKVPFSSPINQRNHLCFTVKRYFNIYVNGLRHWTSKTRVSPFANSSFESVLHLLGYLDMSKHNKTSEQLRGRISEFYLIGKELDLNDMRNFFPTCTRYDGDNVFIPWLGLIEFAEAHSIPLQKVHY